ncbi:hypothetical protein F5B17DRAFT_425874 [Nemania serpens]|nr:hypothetical protein F5B17DRAFT_425874 [Nemania serpens]
MKYSIIFLLSALAAASPIPSDANAATAYKRAELDEPVYRRADAATAYPVGKRADADAATAYPVGKRADADAATAYSVGKRAEADA